MLDIVRLERGKNETLGVLMLNGELLCYTLELPWKDNQKQVSCIPIGIYECNLIKSPKFGECWQITNVPNRDAILIHNGNTHKDILGCVLLGSNVGYLDENRAVLGSKNAVNELMVKTKGLTKFKIEIKEA